MANDKELKTLKIEKSEIEAEKKRLEDWNKELEDKRKELNVRQAKIEKLELTATTGFQDQFEKKYTDIITSIKTREDNVSKQEVAMVEKETTLNTKLNEYKVASVTKIKSELEKWRSNEVNKLTEELTKIRNDSAETIQNLNTQIASITTELTEAKNEFSIAISTQTSNEKTIRDLQNQIAKLTGEKQVYAGENENLKKESLVIHNQLKENADQIAKQVAEIEKFKNLKVLMGERSLDSLIENISDLENKENELKEFETKLNEEKRNLDFKQRLNDSKEKRLQTQAEEFESEVDSRIQIKIASYTTEIERLKSENNQYKSELDRIKASEKTFEDYADMAEKAELLKEVESYKKMCEELSAKVKLFPSEYIEVKMEQIHQSEENIKAEQNMLNEEKAGIKSIKDENTKLHDELNDTKFQLVEVQKVNSTLQEELRRFTDGDAKDIEDERNRRIEEINKPVLQFSGENNPSRLTEDKQPNNEHAWLESVIKEFENYGFVFPKRIINAFQTSLKCAEISPLTVLGGVSGTGKSELVRLFAHFGGLNCLSIPVQPNWACPEDMLGFFNSLDNRFEPQEVLRYLAQTQRDPGEVNQEGLDDVMNIVLLDEMNLANPELYFADFLSKLETRRGCDDDHIPSIDVKIGSGMQPWGLKLGRNVLWTGTMNNDETTKTLSDKVLDRGIIINFPRPKTLESRKLKSLPEKAALISKKTWKSWLEKAYEFSEEEMKPYKKCIEAINEHLGKTGRALGHRVWQSIQTYMSNYPDVIAATGKDDRKKAMDMAFEDQLVQKVMPKLRGIETRGTQGEALDAIQNLIPDTLKADFENAKEFANGQSFMWCTSDYINEDAIAEEKKTDENTAVNTDISKEEQSDSLITPEADSDLKKQSNQRPLIVAKKKLFR